MGLLLAASWPSAVMLRGPRRLSGCRGPHPSASLPAQLPSRLLAVGALAPYLCGTVPFHVGLRAVTPLAECSHNRRGCRRFWRQWTRPPELMPVTWPCVICDCGSCYEPGSTVAPGVAPGYAGPFRPFPPLPLLLRGS